MSDRDDLLDTITRLFWYADHHRWDDLVGVFADTVRLDYTSLQGGEPADVSARDIVAGWTATFEAIDAHQHLVANHLVDIGGDAAGDAAGDTATVTASFIATHQYDGDTWTLGGDYRFEAQRLGGVWKVAAMTMTAVWQTGDPALLSRASS